MSVCCSNEGNPGAYRSNDDVSNDINDVANCGFCSMTLKAGDKGEIASPGWPDEPYPSNSACLWALGATGDARIRLRCDQIDLPPNRPMNGDSPDWNDVLIVSPTFKFTKSWAYCGHATKGQTVVHESLCNHMAVSFKSDGIDDGKKGFHCTYEVISDA